MKRVMRRAFQLRLVHALMLGVVLASGLQVATAAEPKPFKIFSGEPRRIVVHGYSTSFHWWAFLQRKIDRHLGGAAKRVIEVHEATNGGTPIAAWMDLTTGEPSRAWGRILTPAIQGAQGRPVIVLAQQSLQWAFGERGAGIANEKDAKRIRQGADAIATYAKQILEDGAAEVFIAMHIYKKPMEPEIGNERLALAEFLKRGVPHVHAGPDVWVPTSKQHPNAFASDGMHPNSIGAEIMAHYWFQTLLEHDGLSVPAWSRQEMEAAIKQDPIDLSNAAFLKLLDDWSIDRKARRPGRNR